MQGTEDHVTGQRRLNGIYGRFFISDFADQNDIWIMTQQTSKACGESQANIRLNLNLVNSAQRVFDWIFDRNDLELGTPQRSDRAISVVVLPLPVGPVTSTRPDERRMSRSHCARSS